jgi:uncharacterized protein YqjF (DUF2071 family)
MAYPAEPDARVRVPMLHQRWDENAFLHWSYEPSLIRPLVPPVFDLDVYDGRAWVGLVLFRDTTGPPWARSQPLGWAFPEINVRTYVRGPDGRKGVWFMSLDVASGATALGGVALGLPYRWSRMAIVTDTSRADYLCRRHVPSRHTSSRVVIDIADAPAVDGDLDRFLTARFRLFGTGPLGAFEVPIEHPPWTLASGRPIVVDDRLCAAAGVPVAVAAPPLVHVGASVDVRVGWPRRLGAHSDARRDRGVDAREDVAIEPQVSRRRVRPHVRGLP